MSPQSNACIEMAPTLLTSKKDFRGIFTYSTQKSLVLGDPPGVWPLYIGVSCQGSRLNLAFDLIGGYDSYEESVFCPIIV